MAASIFFHSVATEEDFSLHSSHIPGCKLSAQGAHLDPRGKQVVIGISDQKVDFRVGAKEYVDRFNPF
jgi:hypothetical protein